MTAADVAARLAALDPCGRSDECFFCGADATYGQPPQHEPHCLWVAAVEAGQ